MMKPCLLTGGTGRLGRALRKLIPELIAPPRTELDITVLADWESAVRRYRPTCVIHAAAYTSVKDAEIETELCQRTNVDSVEHLVTVAGRNDVKVIFISTDYVFSGNKGNYREDDETGPTVNHYSETKRLAEKAIEKLNDYLIIRTSFRLAPWPYQGAFLDLFTSQDYLERIAPEIAYCITMVERVPYNKLHIATERKSLYELAIRTDPDVVKMERKDTEVPLPFDVSLNTDRWLGLKSRLRVSEAKPDRYLP